MFNTKYRIENIEELTKSNPMHADIIGKICYPVYFATGKRGLFLAEIDEYPTPPFYPYNLHRIFTSYVKDVVATRDGGFTVTTENSKYIFKAIMEE